jgi:hypothetical protein
MRSYAAAEKGDEGMALKIFTRAEDMADSKDNLGSHAHTKWKRANYLKQNRRRKERAITPGGPELTFLNTYRVLVICLSKGGVRFKPDPLQSLFL